MDTAIGVTIWVLDRWASTQCIGYAEPPQNYTYFCPKNHNPEDMQVPVSFHAKITEITVLVAHTLLSPIGCG